jgi:type IV secretory pathway TraG/TraD family ATPase VirD4
MFEQARSAQLVMMPAVQTLANLDAVSEELREMVIGNTVVKIAFRVGTQDTAERFADLFGTEMVTRFNVSAGRGGGVSASAGTGQKQSLSMANSVGYSESSEEVHRVTINDLRGMEKGECIVSIGGRHIYHVKVPQIKFSDAYLKRIGAPEINRARRKYARGLRLFENAEKWIS